MLKILNLAVIIRWSESSVLDAMNISLDMFEEVDRPG